MALSGGHPLFLTSLFSQCMLLTLLLIARFVCTRISKTRGMLSKERSYVTKKSLLLFFFLVYRYLTYCHIIWSSTYPTNIINRIYLLQKRVVQTICATDYRAPSKPIFQKLGYLSLFKIYFKPKVKDYSTRYVKSYRPHTCRTNLKILQSYTKD